MVYPVIIQQSDFSQCNDCDLHMLMCRCDCGSGREHSVLLAHLQPLWELPIRDSRKTVSPKFCARPVPSPNQWTLKTRNNPKWSPAYSFDSGRDMGTLYWYLQFHKEHIRSIETFHYTQGSLD